MRAMTTRRQTHTAALLVIATLAVGPTVNAQTVDTYWSVSPDGSRPTPGSRFGLPGQWGRGPLPRSPAPGPGGGSRADPAERGDVADEGARS